MRILLVHNRYQLPGGEDQVFEGEARLLALHGHDVLRYELHNSSIATGNRLALAGRTIWSRPTHRDMGSLIRRERPDLVHFHNTLPLISPSGYYATNGSGVPVVQTLHNYRLVCPNALLFRDGGPCHDCVGKSFAWPGIVHACYRNSRTASATVAVMNAVHHALGTWRRRVTLYIALTQFARARLLEGGFPAEQVVVKPNFVDPDPGMGDGAGGYALFVGRLSPEKGIRTLLAAWEVLGSDLPLRIIGDGPLANEVVHAARKSDSVQWLGPQPTSEVYRQMAGATVLVCPSEWYETFGRVVIEAFATGTPVIGSSLGAVAELVLPGETGLLFQPGNPTDLVAAVRSLVQEPQRLQRMRQASREEFLAKFTAERNYNDLMGIYDLAAQRHQAMAAS